MMLQILILTFIGYNQGIERLGEMDKEFEEMQSQGFRSVSHMDIENSKLWFQSDNNSVARAFKIQDVAGIKGIGYDPVVGTLLQQ